MKSKDKKEIWLTKSQYLALAKVVYLGNWMANAQRTGSREDPHMREYEEISDYIFSLAKDFGFSKSLEHDLECNEHGETTEVNRLHEEYDEENLWDELIDMLGERDFFSMYSTEEIKKMSDDERFMKRMECEIVWEEEFENYGIERLHALKQVKDFGIL